MIYLVSTLQEKQQQRLMPKFDDQENKKLNRSIKNLGVEMSKDLKDCEIIIKEIINDTNNDTSLDINNEQIKQNMKQNVLTKLNEFTKKFKLNQEIYTNKFKDFAVGEDMVNMSMRKDMDLKGSNDFLTTQENNDQLRRRDNELNNSSMIICHLYDIR